MRAKDTSLGYVVSLDDYGELSLRKRRSLLLDFVIESNLIEGIKYDPVRTRNVDDFKLEPELWGHYKALRYVMKNYAKKNIDNNDIKYMHKLLMNDFLNNAGEYRKTPIYIGKKGAPHYRHVNKLMNELESRIMNIEDTNEKNYDKIFDIHFMFENIHPFSDGNGRTGRLLLNWLTLKNFNEFNIITADHMREYFNEINIYEQKFRAEHPKVRFYKDSKHNPNEMRDMMLLYELQKASEKHPFKA